MIILIHSQTKKIIRFPNALMAAQWLSQKSSDEKTKWGAYAPMGPAFADLVDSYTESRAEIERCYPKKQLRA